MLQKLVIIKFIAAIFAASMSFTVNSFAQSSQWLDMKPLTNWNSRKRIVLETKKMSASELKRCSGAVRQPTFPQDFLLTDKNWTLAGGAQILGKTAIITTVEAFDRMCRPLEYETYVFVGSKFSGGLAPGSLNSRADGSLINVRLDTETEFINTVWYRKRAENSGNKLKVDNLKIFGFNLSQAANSARKPIVTAAEIIRRAKTK